jgi:hypothetical protein
MRQTRGQQPAIAMAGPDGSFVEMEPNFTQSREFPVRKRLHANPQRSAKVMQKVRHSYRAHSARGLWDAVSVLTVRVSTPDLKTSELVECTKALCAAAEALRILAGDGLPKPQQNGGSRALIHEVIPSL